MNIELPKIAFESSSHLQGLISRVRLARKDPSGRTRSQAFGKSHVWMVEDGFFASLT